MPFGFGPRLGSLQGLVTPSFGSVFVPSVVAGGTLVITSGAVTLVNGGTSAVTVTDGTNPVTGCTLVISDSSKGSAVGQNVYGKGTSGTFTVKAQKAGYTDSATVTFTCSSGLILNLDPLLGTNTTTNGAAVTSWADQSATAGSFAEAVLTPAYESPGPAGLPDILFNGTTSLLSTATVVAAYNPARYTMVDGFQTTVDSPLSNRVVWGNAVSGTGGEQIFITTTNQFQFGARNAGGVVSITSGTNAILAAAGHVTTCQYDDSVSQMSAWLDSVLVTGSPASVSQSPNTATVARIGIGNGGTSNWCGMHYYGKLKYNRVLTSTERAQAEFTMRLRMGL